MTIQSLKAATALVLAAALPAAAADMTTHVTIDQAIEDTIVTATGSVRAPVKKISDIKVGGKALTEGGLKVAMQVYFANRKGEGCVPTSIDVADPTPRAGAPALFKHYGWAPVGKVLSPVDARVTHAAAKPFEVLVEPMTNNTNSPLTVTGSLQERLSDTVSWQWSSSRTGGAEQGFEYERDFFILGKAKGSTKVSLSTQVGKGGSEQTGETLVSTSTLSQSLQPGETVNFVSSASRGGISAEITYEVTYEGNMLVNFAQKCAGHHHYRVPINAVLNDDVYRNLFGLSQSDGYDRVVEKVDLEFFTNIAASATTPPSETN